MSTLELNSVWAPPLSGVSASFGPGASVVVGAESDGTPDLIALCAGVRRPRRGWLQLNGIAPAESPELRQRVASLLASEAVPAAGTVKGWLEDLGALRGFDAREGARQYCPAIAHDRPLASLQPVERRRLALAVALGQPDPMLVALHEPLAALEGSVLDLVLSRLRELAQGTIVLVTTASARDARRLEGSVHVLERGVLARRSIHAWPAALTPGLPVELSIECRAPRELLQHLLSDPAVSAASFGAGRARVTGSELAALSRAVMRAAVATAAEVSVLQVTSPDLSQVHASTADLGRAAYRAAQSRPRSGELSIKGEIVRSGAANGPRSGEPAPDGEGPSKP